MADEKKFLDQSGVEFLWSKISMEDYPNNDILIAVLNAIDETKADKEHTHNVYTKDETYSKSEVYTKTQVDNLLANHSGLPSSSSSNNGQFLQVVNGKAAWVKVADAEGASF